MARLIGSDYYEKRCTYAKICDFKKANPNCPANSTAKVKQEDCLLWKLMSKNFKEYDPPQEQIDVVEKIKR
jgi:hypothetical protein